MLLPPRDKEEARILHKTYAFYQENARDIINIIFMRFKMRCKGRYSVDHWRLYTLTLNFLASTK